MGSFNDYFNMDGLILLAYKLGNLKKGKFICIEKELFFHAINSDIITCYESVDGCRDTATLH